MTNPVMRMFGLVILAMLAGAATACSEKEAGYEVVSLEGTVDAIERETDTTGKLRVTYYSEKHKQDMAGTGVVNEQTEILINGASARLADLKEGDRVRGEVRIEKKDKDRVQTAIKIIVDRPRPIGG